MEENKNLNTESEETLSAALDEENFDIVKAAKGSKNSDKKPKKAKKSNKIKNQSLFKRGSYSLAITAAVLVGIVIINVLVSALSKRFVLEFDMTSQKLNSISEENIDFIKNIENKVTITFCADDKTYADGYMSYYAQMYGVSDEYADSYYDQTLKLVKKYGEYNDNITVEFIDTQSSEFTQIASKYAAESPTYGDIIVTSTVNGVEKHKKIGYTDIYYVAKDSTYESYGIELYYVNGNNIETALTGAIAYVTSEKIKKAAIITGHSANDYTSSYKNLLKNNNYDIEVISESVITNLPKELDMIVIPAPTVDFLGEELKVISEFLDNGGKLGKGLIFFADVNAPYLTNLYSFLEEWGIAVDDGIMFETNKNYHLPDDPTAITTYPTGKDKITSSMQSYCLTGYNVPLSAVFETQKLVSVTSLVASSENVVCAPKGTTAGWADYEGLEPQSYSSVIQSKKATYDEENNLIASYVTAFSSADFLQSSYSEQYSVSNKNIMLAVAERAAGVENTGISFVHKQITDESFYDSVTAASARNMLIIFMLVLPLATVAVGIYVYIKRRNS